MSKTIQPNFWVQTGVLWLILLALPSFSVAQKVSRYTETYTNGQPKLVGKIKGTKKVGFWIFYTESGKIQAKERWKKGDFCWRIEYNEKQKPAKSIDSKGKVRFYKGCNCKN